MLLNKLIFLDDDDDNSYCTISIEVFNSFQFVDCFCSFIVEVENLLDFS